ncbi:lipoprotein-releasing ABC transporter permease subunit [Rhodopseudomonas palustris]|uniref:Lipoprotein-releasing ABC transporter permease subunit n=1 Tax=Rhodopseudomonas palustris (strain ATCC BAA-98 / CGA009) TaxID=258594 RepID=Q6N5P7_RHOPA|nr:lipoprotein-releasing ABC transporter permease subunit [Rhodopseudomonas palustris]OPF89854.1 multidrug ABC transporter substrate-binding protein [Rhodopseudomonas palustris]PPQ45365.1 lipoprotein-releasing system transmembrane subunit LolC [Rhodopseudomonas palustris]QLH71983.1 lipoprotein-releasing ABC transporter permease subunit [Rhodopseudomonas palustris]RIA01556.1 lipoprotein-releasing ABC transporter permease subunit [Rhodopseudomonas palustris]RJF65905.1 lipoprotein-releasing ABC t
MDHAMNDPVRTPPFAPFEWLISGRYLRARRREGFISVIAGFSFLGIMLGVATLIIVMAVMNGFRKELLDKILGLNGHLLVQPLESPLTDWKDVADRLSGVQGIKLAAPVVDGQALASSPFNASGVFVRGIRADDLNRLSSIANHLKQGTLEGFDDSQGVAIGRRLADQLSLHAGDSITLVAPRGAVTPMGTTPRIKPYKVAAVFEIGMSEYDSTFVFMPLKEAQAYFNRANDVTAIEVYTDNPDRIDVFRKAVTEAAGRPVFLVDWRQRNSTFFNALQVERNVMFLILTLIVLVAALNIISGLIMLVKDKGADIAILRTMGASQGSIMRVFLITGAAIGVVGTLTGFFVGVLVCMNIESIRQFLSWVTNTELFSPELYFLSKLPAEIDFAETSAVVIMALTLSFLATLYPSWRAARLDPVDALRYE